MAIVLLQDGPINDKLRVIINIIHALTRISSTLLNCLFICIAQALCFRSVWGGGGGVEAAVKPLTYPFKQELRLKVNYRG